MLIAQLTDPHVVEHGELLWGRVDTNGMLEAAVDHINALAPAVDVVVATGDLVNTGDVAQYDELTRILGELDAPLLPVVGNHDDRSAFVAAFDWIEPVNDFVQYMSDQMELRFVIIDTIVPNAHHGELCEQRLAWLDATLADAPERPTIVLMHHPPFETGIEWMDATRLANPDALAAVIARHRQVVRVLCGHVHRPIQASFGGTIASVGPSTAHQIDLALHGVRHASFAMDPPAVQVHRWTRDAGLVSHLSYIGGPEPFQSPWSTAPPD